ncbi:hypothetical protein [Chryseobacterium sp. StRB126]|uniref:hypothetical protein n=1 Tax=Chryseobacterium sp. StRB126 TaxID=878220 RepID=UPI00118767DC|nr:hypothetical protein [Chryseobacterium sp. StRB126]
MRKKIILRLILFSVLAFSIYSCMHDDLSNPQPEQQAPASSFNVFRKDSTGKDPDYARGFAVLYGKYQNLHPAFKQSVARNIKDGKPAVFFRLASEVLMLDDGSKAVIYPVVTDDHITGLAAGVLNQEENYVSYRMVSETTENYENIISAFRIRFALFPKDNTMKPGGNGSGCNDVSGCGETQIEPIVIRPKPRSIQWGGSGDNDPWGNDPDNPPGGECGGFGDCGGSGGNNNPSNPETPQNPCEKIKEKQNSSKYAERFNALNKADIFNMDRERGFYEKQPPLGVNTEAGFVQVDGPPGSTGLDLPDDTTGISGLFHSHNNVDGSIKIFSPTDVKTFINTFLKNAGTYGGGYANAYSTVVTSEGSYTIKYTGTAHPGGVDYYTAKSWGEWYEREMGAIQDSNGDISQDKVETVFTRFLQEVVNKPGLEVYKVTANTASKMTYNPTTKKADKVDCP